MLEREPLGAAAGFRGVERRVRIGPQPVCPGPLAVLFAGESSGLGRVGYQEEPCLGESPWS